MLRTLASLLAVATLALCLGAAETPAIEQLVDQLGSNDFAKREEAARLLKARGAAALPALRQALSHPDLELRRRAQDLIAEIERSVALNPKLVTLNAEQQPFAQVAQALQEQIGYPVVVDKELAGRRLSVVMKDATFWEAIEKVRQEGDLQLSIMPFKRDFTLQAGKSSPFIHLEGPFRLEATKLHEDRDRDFSKPGEGPVVGAHSHLLTLSVAILAEPRFILLATDPAVVEEALDEKGQRLPSAPGPKKQTEEGKWWAESNPLRRDFQHDSQVTLRRSTVKAKTIKTLRGTIPVWIVAQRKPVVVSENVLEANGLKIQLGNDTLEIIRAERIGNSFYLAVSVPVDRPGIPIYWHNRVSVKDAQGKACKENGHGHSISGQDRSISVTYEATEASLPRKLTIEDWTIIRHSIPFEFKDVPLP